MRDRDFDFRQESVLQAIKDSVKPGPRIVDFHRFATKVIGDAIASNMMMVGYAWQLGLLPLSEAALMRAIEMNGVAIEMNKTAFRWGRVAARRSGRIAGAAGAGQGRARGRRHDPGRDRLAPGAASDRLSGCGFGGEVSRGCVAHPGGRGKLGSEALTRAVAINYAKVLAYKDEYEVARLLTDPAFERN